MLWWTRRQLKSKNAAARQKAVAALCQAPSSRDLPLLRALLDDPEVEIRRLAVTAIGHLQEEGCAEALIGALRDQDAGVVRAAITALRRTPDDRVILALTPLLRHRDASIRTTIAQTLESLNWQPKTRQEQIWMAVARGQFSRAASFGPEAVEALEQALLSAAYGVRVRAVEALGSINHPGSRKALLQALKSPDAAVAIAALDALSSQGGPDAVEAIVPMLRHANSGVRVAAIEALSRLGAGSTVPLLQALLEDANWDVRRAAAEALGRLQDPRAVVPLTRALQDADADVREAGAMALGNLSDRQAIGPLILALKDPHSSVRRIASGALTRIDPQWSRSPEAGAVVEQLKASLGDADSAARHFVEQLLVNLGALPPKDTPAAGQEADEAAAVSSPLKRRKLAVSLYLAMLCDRDRDLRQAAAEALGRLGENRAEAALARALSDSDPGVRWAAEQAIEALAANPQSGANQTGPTTGFPRESPLA
ncbi:MAG TPA: HEAT repeat domain-containing protein [Kiritimatiellia bacterium]|nr:HEAT repeat domain-containing protein [Kiritimatiellia bacterium]